MKQRATLKSKLRAIGRFNLSIVAAFVLAFVGFGTWYVSRSEAAGTPCVELSYSYSPGTYKVCVVWLQRALQQENYYLGSSVPSPGAADGYFGTATRNSVWWYQYNQMGHQYASGVVTAKGSTWIDLCSDLYHYQHNYGSSTSGTIYNTIGCSLIY